MSHQARDDNRRFDAPHLAAGADAEDIAAAWLERRGFTCIARNFRCRFGEIDLVMRDDDCLVFVEVRYRKTGSQLSALESIDPRKQRKLAVTANWFLARNPQFSETPVRFDVIAFDGPPQIATALQWLPDAFRPGA